MTIRQRVLKSFTQQKLMSYIGARLTTISKGFCEITLPYNKNLTQQDDFIHAGIIGAIADSAGGYAAYTLMDEEVSVLSVEYKLNLLSPATGDYFIARSHVVKAGKTITVCNSEVWARKGKNEKLCATATVTLIAVKSKIKVPK